MAKQNVIRMGDYHFSGKTMREARAKAEAFATEALSGTYTPSVSVWKGVTMIVWRDPQAFNYRLLGGPFSLDSACVHRGFTSWEDAQCSAAFHAAQSTWTVDGGDDVHEWAESRAGDHESWCAWQRRYCGALQAGKTHEEARSAANQG